MLHEAERLVLVVDTQPRHAGRVSEDRRVVATGDVQIRHGEELSLRDFLVARVQEAGGKVRAT